MESTYNLIVISTHSVLSLSKIFDLDYNSNICFLIQTNTTSLRIFVKIGTATSQFNAFYLKLIFLRIKYVCYTHLP